MFGQKFALDARSEVDETLAELSAEVDRLEWLEDPRFATMEARAANRETVLAAVDTIVAGAPQEAEDDKPKRKGWWNRLGG